MNPHELLKHTYENAAPSEDFSERVLQAARSPQRKTRHTHLPGVGLIVALLVMSLAVTAAATGLLRDWLSGVVDIGDEKALETAEKGELLLECDASGMHAKFGQFLCVGRFLYIEVEISKDDGTEVSEQDLYDMTFDSIMGYGLTFDYETPYHYGKYSVDGEGYVGHATRLDDGSVSGYARFTLSWTLSRHDYAGETLHVQLWEPYEWEYQPDGTMRALNEDSRQMLAESVILRQKPADEITYYFDNGDEVRICAFGAEIQGKDFIAAIDDSFQKGYQNGSPVGWARCGVLLADGTRIPFNSNVSAGLFPELDSADHWSAAPFSATIDPTQAVAIYLGDTVLPLNAAS